MKKEEGTNVLLKVEKIVKYGEQLEMIYITSEGMISHRRIKILKRNEKDLQAYCYLRRAYRTFKIENILALVPVHIKKGVAV